MHVAIGIITFKRADSLRRLLLKLFELESGDYEVSVIVVDNDPACSARAVCATSDESTAINVTYVSEPEPGIVAARNACVAEFLSMECEYLAFIDDDEWPDSKNWLRQLVDTLRKSGADIAAGDVLSVAATDTPGWATEILYEPSRLAPGSKMSIFYTGNVVISRHVFTQLGTPFDARFALTGASDYHFALRCMQAGFTAVFADACVLEEFPADRATTGWFVRRGYRSGAGYSRSQLMEGSALRVIPKSLLLAGVRTMRGLFLACLGVLTLSKVRMVKGLFRIAAGAGTLSGLFGLSYAEYGRLHREG